MILTVLTEAEPRLISSNSLKNHTIFTSNKKSITVFLYAKRFKSSACVQIYSVMFSVLTLFHAFDCFASCIHRISFVSHRDILVSFIYSLEKQK